MWMHYRRTFVIMQTIILALTAGLFLLTRIPLAQTLSFFAIMQLCSLMGAKWAGRLRAMADPNQAIVHRQ